ncbi:hypothetical protein [Humisphaera borealis]|nr:hypothetical protein [Humisphaera borealis]
MKPIPGEGGCAVAPVAGDATGATVYTGSVGAEARIEGEYGK